MNTKLILQILAVLAIFSSANIAVADQKPNVVILMADDVGWNDFGAYTGGGAALGHPTPNIDRVAKEGALLLIGMAKQVALLVAHHL